MGRAWGLLLVVLVNGGYAQSTQSDCFKVPSGVVPLLVEMGQRHHWKNSVRNMNGAAEGTDTVHIAAQRLVLADDGSGTARAPVRVVSSCTCKWVVISVARGIRIVVSE
jgi:hypothetical protein